MNFFELAEARYSVRSFDARPVEEDVLRRVLEAGRLAPSAKNRQPWHVYVLQSPQALAAIRTITPCAFNAPVVLLLCGDTQTGWTNPFNGRNATEMDCSICAAHMMLQAAELGLGTTWACWLDMSLAKERLSLPANHEPFVLMPLGYPAADSAPSGQHGSRKPLSETVTQL